MTVVNLYSVPVFVEQLPDKDCFTKEEISLLKTIELEKQYGDDGNYLSKDIHILEKYRLTRVKDLCDRYVSDYTSSILGINDRFKMFKSWLSMNTDGTCHSSHSHRNTMISCILYFDEYGSSQPMAPIYFQQDGLDQIFKTFQFKFDIKEPNQYNNNSLTVYPKTNMMIIFPGWIKHGTEKSSSSIDRYCLGTNYFFEGEFATGYHNITIKIP